MSGQVEIFIYYRVSDAGAAGEACLAALAQLRSIHPTLQVACYLRDDGQEPTLMETYAIQGGSVDEPMQRAIAAVIEPLMKPWLAGQRRTERFVRLI